MGNRDEKGYSMKKQECIVADKWLPIFLNQLNNGKKIRLSPSGNSMYPFIFGGRDAVILEKIDRPLRRGDICMYRRDNGLHVLHRIFRINARGIYMIGDHQVQVEGPLRQDQMLAVACKMIRKDHEMDCTSGKVKMLSDIWLALRLVRPVFFILWHIKRVITGEEKRDRKKLELYYQERNSR